ncbi:MAG: hypothetical protein HN909_06290 [Phycisphaerales bacterium]|jgi:hypothetical protein|nr:hypothetical protein [Phycisphaerales bacterium]MBT7171361.1 hypothetical protein [Phycisphaerales bacterium]
MKQWTTVLLVAVFSMTLIVGCGGSPTQSDGTPEGDIKEVVSKFVESYCQMDLDTASECIVPGETKTEQAKTTIAKVEAMSAEELENQKAKLANIKLVFGEVKIAEDGTTATCKTIATGMAGRDRDKKRFNLKKVDGKWYISGFEFPAWLL